MMDCFAQSQRSVPKILRTAVRYATLGADLTDVRIAEVERRLTKQNNHHLINPGV